MRSHVSIEGLGRFTVQEGVAKLEALDSNIRGLESTITGHRNSISECERQIAEIKKQRDPLRKELIHAIGGGT